MSPNIKAGVLTLISSLMNYMNPLLLYLYNIHLI